MKLSEGRVDIDSIDNGAWVDDIPDLKGVSFKTRGRACKLYKDDMLRATTAHQRKMSKKERMRASVEGGVSVEEAERYEKLDLDLVFKHLLVDWRGVDDDDTGEQIPINAETVNAIKTQPDLELWRKGVLYAVNYVDAGMTIQREEVAGN